MTKQEQIAEARASLNLAEAKHRELREAAEFLRDELPKTERVVHSLRAKLQRLEKGDAVKASMASELDWLRAQIEGASA